ncbi:hypothetical protein HYH03_011999 [Edaphochlamys debaryana]|uniref:Uncharacterized protein n=1 Tax=Edaphochlamys debaryana TaxID=47281 RepID=A0A835XV20_9CHLO|nr:hypothetical protein HYH03_011999 [Edaphochlamys debaryana]|eukprot:KAG2489548.1 hypothetical protein HYH03_011999 [Edaphochlamys debaryana]
MRASPSTRAAPARRGAVRVFCVAPKPTPSGETVSAPRALLAAGLAVASSLTLLASPFPAHAVRPGTNVEADAATSPLIQSLLKKSAENKQANDDERKKAYYKKAFREYFEYEGGDARASAARGITPETRAEIQKWLEANK